MPVSPTDEPDFPSLDFERIAEMIRATGIPVEMDGGPTSSYMRVGERDANGRNVILVGPAENTRAFGGAVAFRCSDLSIGRDDDGATEVLWSCPDDPYDLSITEASVAEIIADAFRKVTNS